MNLITTVRRIFSSKKISPVEPIFNPKKKFKKEIYIKNKDHISCCNLIYEKEENIKKILEKKRKEINKKITDVLTINNTGKKKDDNYLRWLLLSDNNLWDNIKRFFQTKEKRNAFLKKTAILSAGIIGYTVLCIFFPPALGVLIPVLGSIAIGSCIKLMHRSKIKEKNWRNGIEKMEKTCDVKNEIDKNFEVVLQDTANKMSNFKTLSVEEQKEVLERTNQEIKKHLQENPPTISEKKKSIQNYFTEKEKILCKMYEDDLKKISKIKAKYLILEEKIIQSNDSRKEDQYIQEMQVLYTEIKELMNKHELTPTLLAKFSIGHKIKQMAQSDVTLTILSIAAFICTLGFAKVYKVPSSQVTPLTLFADDASKQSLQLLGTLALGNKLSYPDSWRKSVVEIHNQTNEQKLFNFEDSTQRPIYNENKDALPQMPCFSNTFIKNILTKQIADKLYDDDKDVIISNFQNTQAKKQPRVKFFTENLTPTSPPRSSYPYSKADQRQFEPQLLKYNQ